MCQPILALTHTEFDQFLLRIRERLHPLWAAYPRRCRWKTIHRLLDQVGRSDLIVLAEVSFVNVDHYCPVKLKNVNFSSATI